MMKEEFEALVKKTVNEEDYKVIEYVYANHPLFDTKKKAADAYKLFGISIFIALKPETKKYAEAYEAMRLAMIEAEAQQQKYKALVNELCIEK